MRIFIKTQYIFITIDDLFVFSCLYFIKSIDLYL